MGTAINTTPLLAREAYPNALLFSEHDGIYWLRGKDLLRAKDLLGLACGEKAVGFDDATAWLYIHELTAQGVDVALAHGNIVRTITACRRPAPCRVRSTPILLAPTLLFGQKELERITHCLNRKHSVMSDLVERIRVDLDHGLATSIKDFGSLYVYQVGEDLYEVDWELTALPPATVEALAVVAYQTGQVLPCQLVPPKPRRGRAAGMPAVMRQSPLSVSEPVTYGQLRLAI